MHFTKTLFLSASFVVAAIAQSPLSFTQVPSIIAAGDASVIEWTGGQSSGTVTIELVKGDTSDPSSLTNVSTVIQRNAQGTSFNWTVPDNLPPADDYALSISQGSDVSYSDQISVGSVGSSSTTSTLPPASTTFFSALSTSTTLAPSASASSVSAVISSLGGALSSLSANATAIVSVTTTLGTAVSVGTGSPSTANGTFVSQTLSATASSTASSGTTGSSTSSSSSTSATSTSGASTIASSSLLMLSAFVAIVYLN